MKLLDWLKNNWNHPAEGATALAGAVLSFNVPPADGIALGDSNLLLNLTRVFLIPIVWLIMSVPGRIFSRKSHAWKWFWFSIPMFLCAITIWIAQSQLYARWTCHSDLLNRQFPVGRTFTPSVIKGAQTNEELLSGRNISEEEARSILSAMPACKLIERAEQDPNRVWNADEIMFRRDVLSILYIAGIPIFVIAMISALQGWYCVSRRN